MTEKALDWVKPMLRSLPKLLLVDDQPVNIQTLYQIFADDHEVFMATSGEQALALCRDKQPDLVLLDVIMPGMDGLETCQRLKEDADTADIPVIFATSQDALPSRYEGFDAGADDYITKPFDLTELQFRIRAVLRRVQPNSDEVALSTGDVKLDLLSREVTTQHGTIILTPT